MKTVWRLFCFNLLLLCAISSASQPNTKPSTPKGCSGLQRNNQDHGHTVALVGKVTDKKGNPVSKAEVSLLPDCDCKTCADFPKGCSCCPDQLTLYTDEGGYYRADVPPGKYSVAVDGKTKPVDARSTERATANFKVDMVIDTDQTLKGKKKKK
jgi:hypothetical protein